MEAAGRLIMVPFEKLVGSEVVFQDSKRAHQSHGRQHLISIFFDLLLLAEVGTWSYSHV